MTQEIAKLTGVNYNEQEIPTINVKNVENSTQEIHTEEEKNEVMQRLYQNIEKLYVDEKSKELLKKIIEYMRKYNEGIEKQYISFDMSVISNNSETVKTIITILEDAGTFFKYIKEGQGATFSMFDVEKVKQVLKDLVSLIELKDKAQDDLKIKNVDLHMIFLGNPGTGKTTVARIVAEILYNLKYVKQNKLIELLSKDLVAEYVGQTAPKTMAVIQKALGGVLFVDEAYSLVTGDGQGNSYNAEAIATLIQAMENYRDNLVVIFAGYTKEMQDFLNANSGIVSRIAYTLEFEDYTTEELLKIFTQMMEKSGFIVTQEALKIVEHIINEYRDSRNFGNARFIRNLYEKAIVKHATNTQGKKSKKILKTITDEDINAENLIK